MNRHSNRTIIDRMRRGERCWPAEFALRGAGLVLLGLSALLAIALVRLMNHSPRGLETPFEFLLAALAFFCLTGGLALAFSGPGLFRDMPRPPRALLP
jgi:hypothetical protein